MNIINHLNNDNPRFHGTDDHLTSWGAGEDVLRQIQKLIKPGMQTLETGCGKSTVVFLDRGCHHTTCTYHPEEVTRVVNYCERKGICTDKLDPLIGSTDRELPKLTTSAELDFVLIDGAHEFPFPIIDFHYTENRIRIGGMLAVDDLNIPSVHMLYEFLETEKEWKEICVVRHTAFYRKVAEPTRNKDFMGQLFNQSLVQEGPKPSLFRRVIMKMRRINGRFLNR